MLLVQQLGFWSYRYRVCHHKVFKGEECLYYMASDKYKWIYLYDDINNEIQFLTFQFIFMKRGKG